MISKSIDVEKLILDKDNPRFSYYEFSTDEEIIEYLLKNENLAELIESITQNGYNSLGERLIVLDNGNDTYRVLEGNRRVSSIKLMLKDNIDIAPSNVLCDVVNDIKEAELKISLKHISGIKKWSPVDKKNFYKSRYEALIERDFSQKEAISELKQYSNESYNTIKNEIVKFYFLESVYNLYENKNLNILSGLDTDIFSGRIYNYLTKRLNLNYDSDLKIIIDNFNVAIYNEILKSLAYYVWIEKLINTRSINTNNDFDKLLENDIPELNKLMNNYVNNINCLKNPVDKKELDPFDDIDEETEHNKDDEIAGNIPNLKMIVVDETISANKLPIDLSKNVRLYIDDILSTNKIEFKSKHDNIVIHNSKIVEPTKDGIYTVSATYEDIIKHFDVNISVPLNIERKTIIDTAWARDQIRILTNKPNVKKICTILQYLTTIDLGDSINRLIGSFLLRALMEYSIKIYSKKHNLGIEVDKNLPDSYSQLVNSIIQKNQELWERDKKKVIQSGKDNIHSLNGFIHYYENFPTDIMIDETFNNFKPLLEYIFKNI